MNRARVLALGLLALLGLLAPHVSALALSCCAAAVLLAVAVADHAAHREPEAAGASDETAG